MHWIALVVFGLIAFFWLTHGLRVLYGALHLPRLQNCGAAANEDCASISLLFAARDEEEKLPAALETLSALDYSRLDIVAIDDRSTDATPRFLAAHTKKNERFGVVRED